MNSNKRYPSLQTTMTLALVTIGVIASGFVSYFLYNSYSNQVREDLQKRLINISDITAIQFEAEKLSGIEGESALQNEDYINYQEFLFNVIKKESGIIYIYTMKKAQDGTIYFYLDAGSDPSIEEYDVDIPGDLPYEEPSDLLLAMFEAPKGTVAEKDIYTDEFGSFLSAYTPIYNSDGTLNSILGVDIRADAVVAQEENVRNQTLLFFLVSIVIISVIGLRLGTRFSRPTVALTNAANRIAGGDMGLIESLPSPSFETHQLMLAFNRMTLKLRELITGLEENVRNRTEQLEKANQQVTRRAEQFEAIGQVGRTISSAHNLDTLLNQVVSGISQNFNFYHVGIFLIDSTREYAILRATNSEGGSQMLKRGHKLRVGEQGVVGFVSQSGKARIALDVGEDATYFNNPDLPDTRSEVSLPLKTGEGTLGVLDIQSTESNAFSNDDISTFLILADQVAIAIQNAFSFERTQNAIREAEIVSQQMAGQSWNSYIGTSRTRGFLYDGIKPKALNETTMSAIDDEALLIPVQLR
ncbi:MAG TPA: GAF domain-containing protein, partial [Anaerolineales bacterium]|nr:GAF domain-containing protein [Anaerolineales bacterium]